MTFTPQDFDRIRAAARGVLERHRLPGISIGVVQRDVLVFAEGLGFADIESQQPMTPHLGHRIASITKTMVGLCVMALVDEGRLSLDARVTELLPDVRFHGPAETMTVRHLLTHTSGIGEAPTPERLRDVANPARRAAPGDFSDLYPDGVIVEVEPGSKWAYCNNGYAMLGEIVRRAEAADLHDVMQRRIFGPLTMTDTHILDEPHVRITTGYHRAPSEDARFQLTRAGIPVPDEPAIDGINIRGKFTYDFNRAMRGAGAAQSTLLDMAKYASALLAKSRGIVRADTFDAMTSAQYCPDPRFIHWGYSFERSPRFGRTLVGHGGAYYGGWNSKLSVIAAENIAVIQHMNIMLDDPEPVFAAILRAVLDMPREPLERRPTDASLLESAPGEYRLPMPGALTNFRPATNVGPVRITRDGDALVLTSRWGNWKSGVQLVPADGADPAFFAIERDDAEPSFVAFDRGAGAAVTGLHFDRLVRMLREPDRP